MTDISYFARVVHHEARPEATDRFVRLEFNGRIVTGRVLKMFVDGLSQGYPILNITFERILDEAEGMKTWVVYDLRSLTHVKEQGNLLSFWANMHNVHDPQPFKNIVLSNGPFPDMQYGDLPTKRLR